MSATVQRLLESFDALPATEKHAAAVEILRRYAAPGELPEEALLGAADELFRGLDAEEARNAAG